MPLAIALAFGFWGQVSVASETPGFARLDRADSGSRAEISVSRTLTDNPPSDAARADLYGQITSRRGAGGYASVPVSFLAGEENSSAIGNLEVGGLYKLPGRAPVVLRVGLVLNTAPDNSTNTVALQRGSLGRISEFPSITPNQRWLRLAASPMWRHRSLYFRLDAGLDIPIARNNSNSVALGRLNFGAGLNLGGVSSTLELVNLGAVADRDQPQRFVQMLSLGIRRSGGALQPYAALETPLREDPSTLNAVLVFGLQFHADR